MSWNTKTLRFMEEQGYYGQILEHWCSFSNKRKDVMGFADALFLNPEAKDKILFIQLTSRSNISTRWHKISDVEVKNKKTNELEHNKVRDNAKLALKCGCSTWIIGWDNEKPKCRKGKIREIYLTENGELEYKDKPIEEVQNG